MVEFDTGFEHHEPQPYFLANVRTLIKASGASFGSQLLERLIQSMGQLDVSKRCPWAKIWLRAHLNGDAAVEVSVKLGFR